MHDARWGQIEADTYWGAIDLLRWVGNLIPPAQGRVGFWYSNDDRHRIFNSVQSVFLWGYSRIQSWTDDRGMPVIDEETRKNIESYRYIVLLGFSLKEIDAGVSALRIGGIQFAEIERKTFVGKYLSFEAAIVERLPSEPTFAGRVVDVPTESFKGSGGRITTAGNGIGISTATAQWAYSALADLASMHLPPGPITIRLRLHVKSGSVGFAVSEKGNISKLLTEVDINPTSKPMNVAIPIEDGARAEYLIVRNWSPLGASEVDILNAQ
jgi:hypothetical protein